MKFNKYILRYFELTFVKISWAEIVERTNGRWAAWTEGIFNDQYWTNLSKTTNQHPSLNPFIPLINISHYRHSDMCYWSEGNGYFTVCLRGISFWIASLREAISRVLQPIPISTKDIEFNRTTGDDHLVGPVRAPTLIYRHPYDRKCPLGLTTSGPNSESSRNIAHFHARRWDWKILRSLVRNLIEYGTARVRILKKQVSDWK